MFDLIDDDEWFELGMSLADTLRRLPVGSVIIESLQMPPFRLAISASGTTMSGVITRPWKSGLHTPEQAVELGLEIAESHARPCPGALTIAITQTTDGQDYAVSIVGLAGEQRSWTMFGLAPGGHSIDVGEEILRRLEGWAIRHDRPETGMAAA